MNNNDHNNNDILLRIDEELQRDIEELENISNQRDSDDVRKKIVFFEKLAKKNNKRDRKEERSEIRKEKSLENDKEQKESLLKQLDVEKDELPEDSLIKLSEAEHTHTHTHTQKDFLPKNIEMHEVSPRNIDEIAERIFLPKKLEGDDLIQRVFFPNRIVHKAIIVFNCPICNLEFDSEGLFNDHFISHNLDLSSNLTCRYCNEGFITNEEYIKHLCLGSIGQNSRDRDNIPTSSAGSYECPICHNKYLTQNLLGEHFILAHNNYEEYVKLDEKTDNGFPGFQLLEYINMIDIFSVKKINQIIKQGKICKICRTNYRLNKKKRSFRRSFTVSKVLKRSLSESDLIHNKKKAVRFPEDFGAKSNSKHKIETRKINNNLFKKINKILSKEVVPVKMACCAQKICKRCLKNYIMISNSILCPFCRKDHTVLDSDYIIIIEATDSTDREKWIPWWQKHLEIFYPI